MDPVTAAILLQLAKYIIGTAIDFASQAGATDEEIKAMFVDVHKRYKALPDPSTIPDGPQGVA